MRGNSCVAASGELGRRAICRSARSASYRRKLWIQPAVLDPLRRGVIARAEGRGWVYVFGFWGGLLGGAYNTNGPPVVLYGALRGWPPERFRATLQAYFLPANVLVWGGHGLSGLWTEEVIRLYLFALPLILLAIPLGTRLNRWMPTERFERLLYGALVLLGLLLIV